MNYPAVIPYLYYEDGVAAIEFLEKAFGFRERYRTTNDDGTVGHCELELGDAVVFVAGMGPDYVNPNRTARAGGIYVTVDDVDAHHEQAKAAGASVEGPPADQPYGSRNYGVFDVEGVQWWFSTPTSAP